VYIVQPYQHVFYRVQQKSNPLRFLAVFSAIARNIKAKFYRHIYYILGMYRTFASYSLRCRLVYSYSDE